MNLLTQSLLFILFIFTSMQIHAETITLNNGDQLSGEITSVTDATVFFTHPLLGELSIPRSKISSLGDDQDSPVVVTTTSSATPEAAPVDSGFLNSGWLTNWKRQLSIGIIGASGKSENNKINIGFSADYEDTHTRWAHKTAYYRDKSEGVLSDHSFTSSINRDWLIPELPQFYFAGGQIDVDEFQAWDQRIAVNGGLGYEFIKTESWRLLGRAGMGINRTFGGVRKETTLEGLLGVEAKWKISSDQSLEFANTLYPSFNDTGEFRNLSSLDWNFDLSERYKLGLKVGLTNEYDSLASKNNENDFKYNLSVLLSL
jgi:putative salt-induced outer membrane protein YdiY